MTDPNDGLGWYILEDKEPEKVLKHDTRFNLREAAQSMALFLFPGQNYKLGFWTGAVWEKVELP